jgi:hypothetical protein
VVSARVAARTLHGSGSTFSELLPGGDRILK